MLIFSCLHELKAPDCRVLFVLSLMVAMVLAVAYQLSLVYCCYYYSITISIALGSVHTVVALHMLPGSIQKN